MKHNLDSCKETVHKNYNKTVELVSCCFQ